MQKYVELISTGKFVKVKKFPSTQGEEEITNKQLEHNRLQVDYLLKAVQRKWLNRTN